jgi:hypothetical protein
MSIRDFIDATKHLSKQDFEELFRSSELQKELQEAMLEFPGGNIYDWMTEHKLPWVFWSFIHRIISNRMSIKVKLNTGHEAYISPTPDQLIKDGITFIQGPKRMEGFLCGYKGGKVSVAHTKRDVLQGENLTSGDFDFIELDENGRLPAEIEQVYSFKDAEDGLLSIIRTDPENEAAFQEYFIRFPWVFGLQYKLVQSHKKFDDANIPDFSAVIARNGFRDIIEIKPPGLKMFGKNNKPLTAFHNALSQCERYIDFADANHEYLRREKGLLFDAPIAVLIAGWELSLESRSELRRKERLIPRIRIHTYDDILSSIKSMKTVIDQLSGNSQQGTEPDIHPGVG